MLNDLVQSQIVSFLLKCSCSLTVTDVIEPVAVPGGARGGANIKTHCISKFRHYAQSLTQCFDNFETK